MVEYSEVLIVLDAEFMCKMRQESFLSATVIKDSFMDERRRLNGALKERKGFECRCGVEGSRHPDRSKQQRKFE